MRGWGRWLRCPVAVLLLLAGCAGMHMTLAQELAWERWKKCDHFANIRLNEIRPDGQIWILYSDVPNDVPPWQECLRGVAQEQAARQPTASSLPPVKVAASATDPMSRLQPPRWKVGDEWSYRYESPNGRGTFVWTVDREETVDGVAHYVVKTGGREIYYRSADLAFTLETLDRAVLQRATPSRLRYSWPLALGKSWQQTYKEERPRDRQTAEYERSWSIDGEETLTVPAGTFKTFRIVSRNKQGVMLYEEWYSPEVHQSVRIREYLATGTRERELLDYRRR